MEICLKIFFEQAKMEYIINKNKVVSSAQDVPRRTTTVLQFYQYKRAQTKHKNISRCPNKAMGSTTRYDN
jgi:hypothetical protein